MKADKLVLESALSFARAVDERLVHNDAHRLKGLHLFWTMVDRRERTPLYESYGKAFAAFRLPVLQTQVPYRSRFSKEILDTSGAALSCRPRLRRRCRARRAGRRNSVSYGIAYGQTQ